MRLLVFGDLQATLGNERCFHDPKKSLQHYRVEKFFTEAHRLYESRKCDGVIDLGDLTDDRSSIPVPTLSLIREGMNSFPKGFNRKLVGNHEQFYKDEKVHSGCLAEPRFKVIPDILTEETDDVEFVYRSFPYSNAEVEENLRILSKTPSDKPRILFGHFLVHGCDMGGHPSIDGISSKALDRYSLCLLGHVHKHQKIGKTGFYVGSPFQQDYGEADVPKYVAILDIGPKPRVEWVELPGFPKYKTVNIDQFRDEFEETSEDRVQVVLASLEDSDRYYQHPLASRAVPVALYTNVPAAETSDSGFSPAMGIRDAMEKYAKNNKGPSSFSSEKELILFGESLVG